MNILTNMPAPPVILLQKCRPLLDELESSEQRHRCSSGNL